MSLTYSFNRIHVLILIIWLLIYIRTVISMVKKSMNRLRELRWHSMFLMIIILILTSLRRQFWIKKFSWTTTLSNISLTTFLKLVFLLTLILRVIKWFTRRIWKKFTYTSRWLLKRQSQEKRHKLWFMLKWFKSTNRILWTLGVGLLSRSWTPFILTTTMMIQSPRLTTTFTTSTTNLSTMTWKRWMRTQFVEWFSNKILLTIYRFNIFRSRITIILRRWVFLIFITGWGLFQSIALLSKTISQVLLRKEKISRGKN